MWKVCTLICPPNCHKNPKLSVTITDSVRVIEADAFFWSLGLRSLGVLEVTMPRDVEAEAQSLETTYVYKEFPLDKFRDAPAEGTNAVVKVIDEKKPVTA